MHDPSDLWNHQGMGPAHANRLQRLTISSESEINDFEIDCNFIPYDAAAADNLESKPIYCQIRIDRQQIETATTS